MHVTTRYQEKEALYADVLENPLIFHNIIQHLEPKDVINMLITNAPFTNDCRFQDTVNLFLDKKREYYEKNMEVKRVGEIVCKILSLMSTFETMKHTGASNHTLIAQMCRLFDYIVENDWFLERNAGFAKIVEIKLIEHLQLIDFLPYGLEYLRLLFNIVEQIEEDEFGEESWYIIATEGHKVYF